MRTTVRVGELAVVREAIRGWPEVRAAPTDASTPVQRVLGAARTPERCGHGDLAALLRHVLRAAAEVGDAGTLEIPAEAPWPGPDSCAEHGIDCLPGSSDGWRLISARPWEPDWLDTETDPSAPVLAGRLAYERPRAELPADPFFERLTGFDSYRSPGQREVVRALVTLPSDGALIAALPTGSGKSAVAYLDALAQRGEGLTLVIVPTVALAIDQERAFNEILERRGHASGQRHELAYYGELDDSTRQAIRQRIRSGEQRIVFASPESAVQSLSPALFDAARAGRLRLVAIDEAHIVSEWGADFRPAFQALGALVASLRAAQPEGRDFRILMLSGTLVDDAIATLTALFAAGDGQPPSLVAAPDLRAEPLYWVRDSPDTATREQRMLDAIRHLPRPTVIYTTKVDDAKRLHARIIDSGYRRADLVVGETAAAERRGVITRLRNLEADLVVATSAFGLGVDQPDVRCVVHVCLPETLNRWYQEVGRSGRDDRPSIALLLPASSDRKVAQSLASRRLLSLERGLERWLAMIERAKTLDGDRYRLPLFAAPTDLPGDNDENRRWNLRLLLLMDRAGIVRLEREPPPKLAEEATEDEWERAFEDAAEHATVTLLTGNHRDPKTWNDRVGGVRSEARGADVDAHGRMLAALEPAPRLCELFASTYTIKNPADGRALTPVPTCAGCPGCRALNEDPRLYGLFRPQWPTPMRPEAFDTALAERFGGSNVLVVHYRDEHWPTAVDEALIRLAGLGLRVVSGSPALRERATLRLLHGEERAIFFETADWQRRTAPPFPTAIVIPPGRAPSRAALAEAPPVRVVMVGDDAAHPDHASLRVHEYAACSVSLARFLADF